MSFKGFNLGAERRVCHTFLMAGGEVSGSPHLFTLYGSPLVGALYLPVVNYNDLLRDASVCQGSPPELQLPAKE